MESILVSIVLILSLIILSITGNALSFKWKDLVMFPCWSRSIINTLAPNLEWFERFIVPLSDGDPNLWVDLTGNGAPIVTPFFSGSSFTPVKRARVADINLNSNKINLASGYSISTTGIDGFQFSFYSSSIGNSSNFFSSSQEIVPNNFYYYNTPPQFNITQSWQITTPSLLGSITKIHRSQNEFYNGEFSGSTLIVTNGELNEGCEQFKSINTRGGDYRIRSYNSVDDVFGSFISTENLPLNGYIQTWFQDDSSNTPLPPPNPTVLSTRN